MSDVIEKINIESDIENHVLEVDNCDLSLSLRVNDFNDEKELFKFIKKVELIIRKSPEYSLWTEYLRETLGYYNCAITGEVHTEVTTDIHHHPINLFTIVKTIILKESFQGHSFCSFDIATKVIELHYQNRVGFVPLIRSMHEKYHNGALSIPMELIYGEYMWFIDNYKSFIDENDMDHINSLLKVNKNNCGWTSETQWSRNSYKDI